MAKGKTTIRFWLRTDRANQNGTAPIHIIYQVKGQRRYFAIPDILILPINWNADEQRAVYVQKKDAKGVPDDKLLTSSEVKSVNETMDDLVTDIKSLENGFKDRNLSITSQMVVDALKDMKRPDTKKGSPDSVLFDFIDKYISDHNETRVKGSLSVYRSLKAHLLAYQAEKKAIVTFDNIDYSFFQSFQNFLIGRKKIVAGQVVPMLNNTTIAKQLSTIKTFLNYAKVQGVEISDRYKQFKIKKDTLEVIALTEQEFDKLFNLDLTANKRLAQVRDVFCFACTTGLRYSDLALLRRENIKADKIKLTVKKTKEPLTIPLTPYSKVILAKYTAQHQPLPMISNQKLNDYVKELCKLADIIEPIEIVRFRGTKRESTSYPKYELVGVHTGRKTFASLSLEKGMSAEEVMAITGHKDYKSFQRYVKVTEPRKEVAMSKAWGTIKASNLKAV